MNASAFSLPENIKQYLPMLVEQEDIMSYAHRFLVKRRDEYVSVHAAEVSCFYSEGRVTVLRTADNKKYLVSLSIEKLASELLDPFHFFRVNRSTVISYKSIKEIYILSNHRLKVVLHIPFEKNIYVSRYTIQQFKKWLGE